MTDFQRFPGRATTLGEGMQIVRLLPTLGRRTIGAWCFLDHFGPVNVAAGRGMRVGPHPHIGLQTVTWLLEGEVLHRDSLGFTQPIRPGQLNLMTAGRGISHSEESPAQRLPRLHGAQLWIALPESRRHGEPAFEHHASLPRVEYAGLGVTLIVGEAFGQRSPASIHTPLVGMELRARASQETQLPVHPAYEHGVMVLKGTATVEGQEIAPGELLYFGTGRKALGIETRDAATLLLVGGVPFEESILMWWNFVGRNREELVAVSREWNAGIDRFGRVNGYDGERIPAPLPPWAAEA